MSQNSEQIEAKLCAYLEGELDEQGRVEIEKHLEQNPAHGRLLAEVGKTRRLLRALPRESAPPDICEAFQGQLERSVLLADLDDEAGSAAMKTNRWPQYFAVAAVVTLAAGLGLVVYLGLPSGGPDRNVAVGVGSGAGTASEDGAVTRSLSPGMNEPAAVPAPATQPPGGVVTETGRAGAAGADPLMRGGVAGRSSPQQLAQESAAGALPAQSPAASGPAAAPADELPVLARRVQGSWETKERERFFGTTAASDAEATLKAFDDVSVSATCYVVTSATPGAASERIGQELSRLQVTWSAVPRPDPEALQQKLDGTVTLADGTQTLAVRQSDGNVLAERDESVATSPDAGAAVRPDASVALQRARRLEPEQEMTRSTTPGIRAGAATRGPVAESRDLSTQPLSTQPTSGLAATPEKQTTLADAGSVSRMNLAVGGVGRPETLIIARSLTREQADVLRASLGDESRGHQVRTYARFAPAKNQEGAPGGGAEQEQQAGVGGGVASRPVTGSATTLPAQDAVIRTGDALRLVVGREQGGQTVAEVEVGQNGAVTVPGLGAFQCAGLTVTQLQERLTTESRTGVGNRPGTRVEVSKVGRAKAAAGAAKELDAFAAATDAEVRGDGLGRNDLALRARGATGRASREPAPQPSMVQAAAARPAPAPPAPAPRDADELPAGIGGAAGNGHGLNEPAAAGGVAAVPGDVEQSVQTPQAPAQPSDAAAVAPDDNAQRFDVVIVVRADPAVPATTTLQAAADASAAPTDSGPAGPIEKYEILMVQLGDTDADSVNVRVGDDGMVELPRVGRVKAEGATAANLREQIASKLRSEAGNAKPAEVTVRRVGEGAASPAPTESSPTPEPAAEEPPAGTDAPDAAAPTDAPADPAPAPPAGRARD